MKTPDTSDERLKEVIHRIEHSDGSRKAIQDTCAFLRELQTLRASSQAGKCDFCHGERSATQDGITIACPRCNGTGTRPTQEPGR